MPRIMPAMMDSHGKPGIGGNAKGVETELEADVVAACVVVVGVLTAVLVTTDVLTMVEELVALVAAVALVALVAVVEVTGTVEVLAAVLLEVLAAVVLDVASAVTPPGGSRWNIMPSDPAEGSMVLGLPAVVPTAKPLVLESRNKL
jgi:hypothetical protein